MNAAEYADSLKQRREKTTTRQQAGTQTNEAPRHNPATASYEMDYDLLADDRKGSEVIEDEVILERVEIEPVNLLGLIELILKNRYRLNGMIRVPSFKAELIPRFLAISLIGFLFFGVAMSVVLSATGSWPKLTAINAYLDTPGSSLIEFPQSYDSTIATTAQADNPWLNGAAIKLVLAYTLGLIAATGICLPSLYFYGLLAGIKMSMLDVTIHALKSKATAAIALVGILPVYAAISMGMVIFGASAEMLKLTLILGLILPFIAGFWGTASLHSGLARLCDTLPKDRRNRRECFLRRLVLSWSACYTAIMPIMIFTLWQSMSG